MKKEDCEGCIINLKPIGKNCTCTLFNESFLCPCSICLIKIVCTHGCDLFKEFSEKSYSIRRKKGDKQ